MTTPRTISDVRPGHRVAEWGRSMFTGTVRNVCPSAVAGKIRIEVGMASRALCADDLAHGPVNPVRVYTLNADAPADQTRTDKFRQRHGICFS